MKERMVKGFLIDPKEKTISAVTHNAEDYREIYKLIDASPFTVVQLDNHNCIYVDDEGLLNNPRYFFTLKGYEQPIAGKGLVLGVGNMGETTSTSLSLDRLKEMVGYQELSVVDMVTEEAEVMIGGQKGWAIKTTPIFGPPIKEEDAESCSD